MVEHAGFTVAANISLLFSGVPLLERAGQAKRSGFDHIESWWPFSSPLPGREETDAFVASIENAGVTLIALNLYTGHQAAGDRGVLCWPDHQDSFLASVQVAKEIALRTGCRLFNAPFGQIRSDLSAEEQYRTAVQNLVSAAETMKDIDGTILLEPLTSGANGQYPLVKLQDAADVVGRCEAADGTGNLKLLLDSYHAANNGEDLSTSIRRYSDLIAHVQIADTPGRGPPGTGHIDFDDFFSSLREAGYRGFISCEYVPGATGKLRLDNETTTKQM